MFVVVVVMDCFGGMMSQENIVIIVYGGLVNMDLKLWIRLSGNGLYLVDKEVKEGNLLSKPEVKTYSFNNISELSKWILNGGN